MMAITGSRRKEFRACQRRYIWQKVNENGKKNFLAGGRTKEKRAEASIALTFFDASICCR